MARLRSVARLRTVVARHYGLGQVGVVLAAVSAYELMRLALRPDWPVAIEHARRIAAWERVLHLGWEASLQHAFLRLPELVEGMNAFYLAGHFAGTGLFFVWLYRRSRSGFRLFRNGFLIATALALLVYWRWPAAPPRVAGLGLEDTLRRLSGIDIGSRGSDGLSDPVAAVPSLHVGWALGVGLGVALYARGPAWRAVGIGYPAIVALTVVVTGNHFVLDAVAGLLVMSSGLGLAAALTRPRVVRWRQRRGVEQSGSSPGS